ncbi:MAG: TRAP transporter large permease subunit [Thermodesulfobacteriota bacterium]
MSIELTTLLLFGCLFFLLFIGVHVSFSLLITALIFDFAFFGVGHLYVLGSSLIGALSSQTYIAIPTFIFMGNVLAHTGIADELFEAMYLWTARLRGGLALGTVTAGTILAAMCASSEAGTLTVGIMALPAMMKRGYNTALAIGSITAGGCLGFMIPPSVMAIFYSGISGVSLGKVYFASFIPGLLLAGLYLAYIYIRTLIQPSLCPRVPKEEAPTWSQKIKILKKVFLPLLIIVVVLGGIYSGATTPTEAAGTGAACAIIIALVKGVLTWRNLIEALKSTFKLLGMIGWILMSVMAFSNIYNTLGAPRIVKEVLTLFPAGGLGVIIMMQLSIFLLGMVMDDLALMLLTIPIFVPIIKGLGFDPVWFGVLILINMQSALLTPPYGFNLFYARAITPDNVSTFVIYRGTYPFVLLQILVMILVIAFPSLALWLPSVITAK